MEIKADNLKIDVDALARLARHAQGMCTECTAGHGSCGACQHAATLRAVGHGIPPNKPYREVWQ